MTIATLAPSPLWRSTLAMSVSYAQMYNIYIYIHVKASIVGGIRRESFHLLLHQYTCPVEGCEPSTHKITLPSRSSNRLRASVPTKSYPPDCDPDRRRKFSRGSPTPRTEVGVQGLPRSPESYKVELVSVLEMSFWTSAAISSDVLRTVTLHNCFIFKLTFKS